MMISNWRKRFDPLVSMVYANIFQRFKGKWWARLVISGHLRLYRPLANRVSYVSLIWVSQATWLLRICRLSHHSILPHLVWQSDHWSDLDNRCVKAVWKGGVRATWIFIMTSPVYCLQCGRAHSGQLVWVVWVGQGGGGGGGGGGRVLIALRDIQESAGSNELDAPHMWCIVGAYKIKKS